MAVVVVQMGHVPRASGKTGTWREQELARGVGDRLQRLLSAAGHTVHLMGADDQLPVPRGEIFVSLHGDSGNATVARSGASTRGGASVGYPDANGRRVGTAWKSAHAAAGWPGGFLSDNNTTNMSRYYMWDRTPGFTFRYLAEHATLTFSRDESWIFANLDRAATAHATAIGQVLGGGGAPVVVSGQTHTVRSGDTLTAIGRAFGVDWREIQRVNGIADPARLAVGAVLKIPDGGSGQGSGAGSVRTHTVRSGDTLSAIGRAFGVDWREIQRVNGIADPTKLRVGAVLRIP